MLRTTLILSMLTVSTFNIRNTTDRYEERKPLLIRDFNEIAGDVVGLQEVGPSANQLLAQSHRPTGRV